MPTCLYVFYIDMSKYAAKVLRMTDEATLSELAAASGLQARTIRSWVAQGLIAGPLNRGPMARYPADTLERLQAIRFMRDRRHMPLNIIRRELLVAGADKVRELAEQAADLAPEPVAAPSSALDYIKGLRGVPKEKPVDEIPPPRAPKGFGALEQALSLNRAAPARKARAEEQLRIVVTPEVELIVRGLLDAGTRARLETCADLIRDILLGRD